MRPRLVGFKDKLMLQEDVERLLAFLDEAAASGQPQPEYARLNQARRVGREPRQTSWRDFWRASRLVVRVLLQSGLRCAEVANLQARDCDTSSRPYRLLVRGGKKRRADEVDAVLIPADLAATLREWITTHQLGPTDYLVRNARGGRVNRRWVYELAKAPMRQVGLNPKFATHHYRHRYATTLLQRANGNLLFVQKQLRHRSLQPTATYLHMSDYEAEALDAVDRMGLDHDDGGDDEPDPVQTSARRPDRVALAMQLEEDRRGRRAGYG